MVGDCPPDFLQLAFNCCNMDPKLRPSFPDIVRHFEGVVAGLKADEMEHEADQLSGDGDKKAASKGGGGCVGLLFQEEEAAWASSSRRRRLRGPPLPGGGGCVGLLFQEEEAAWASSPSPAVSLLLREKLQGVKRLNPLGFHGDKIPPKSPRPRRNIWLSRSQSDIFSCKPGRKVSVQDPHYQPPSGHRASKARKINPFTAREDLCGGKIKFSDVPSSSVFSLVFDLRSPPGSAFGERAPGPAGGRQVASYSWMQLPGRRCHSLPKAEPSVWAKRYVVVEIPPYCRQQGEEEDGEGEGRKGEQGEELEEEKEEEELGESWSPMLLL
ncbi:Dual specificity testis-specific protein kinase 2 [Liparis tanakae]|uniref:Dual specificity testis-specific protein kinase 2 n=1 Tax=Liparis tanakae TaxID=230148 RepID=A0A4Z2FDI1_9TELE|nr:Dual specificity testis-specific protein kinase 2 [Liparis tanakae]